MRRDEAYLLDMLIAAREAVGLTAHVTREDFESSRQLQLSIAHLVQTIGEAARQVSESARAGYPAIPWEDIVGMRHRLVHEYFRVDSDVVWNTVRHDLPHLIVQLGGSDPGDRPAPPSVRTA